MAYDGKLLARARDELENIRRRNSEEQTARQLRVYARVPELEKIDLSLRSHMARIVRLTISKSADMEEKIAAIREENLDLQMRRAELLTEYGFGVDYLDEIVSCPLCRDSGVYRGGVCSCLEKLYNMELTKELGTLMRQGDECFERFNLKLYSDEYDEGSRAIPRERMSMVFDVCRNYAENFSTTSRNLIFYGGTGLGKTYISACIARVVAAKGHSVCYETASAAMEYYERAKFSRDIATLDAAAQRVRHMESCDLMILDDLGTEVISSISPSGLYSLLNNRLIKGKKTIISTNYPLAELQRIYMPQIYSRIAGEFTALPFVGKDIRLLRKEV